MAEIKFKGFVQKHEGNRPWEIAEGHRKKGADEKWFTESTTYHKVWLPKGVSELPVDALVTVVGRQVTPKKNGEFKPTPVVYADEVTDKDGNPIGSVAPAAESADVWATPADYTDETPF